MSETPSVPDLPSTRALTRLLAAAVDAAQVGDETAFDLAATELGRGGADRPHPEQLNVVLGRLVGDLLERGHPDGIGTEDAEQVVERCLRRFGPWYPSLDEDQLIRALAGALHIAATDDAHRDSRSDISSGPDTAAVGDRRALLAHGLLLTADLLMVSGDALAPVLAGVLTDLAREQTMEQP